MHYRVTRHAEQRMNQRAVRSRDLALVLEYGQSLGQAVVLTDQVVDSTVKDLRGQISDLERLRGIAVFETDGRIITTYRPGPRKMKTLLREVSR
jgi:hypothetical protein